MDVTSRRERLRTLPSPDGRMDFVTSLHGRIHWRETGTSVRVSVRYVPDRDVLDPVGFGDYLSGLGNMEWTSLEAAGAAILDDVNNQAVPRFVLVSVVFESAGDGSLAAHSVLLEDRQPGWDNPYLLARLARD